MDLYVFENIYVYFYMCYIIIGIIGMELSMCQFIIYNFVYNLHLHLFIVSKDYIP